MNEGQRQVPFGVFLHGILRVAGVHQLRIIFCPLFHLSHQVAGIGQNVPGSIELFAVDGTDGPRRVLYDLARDGEHVFPHFILCLQPAVNVRDDGL